MYLKWGIFSVPNGQIQIVPLVKLLNLSVLSKKKLPTGMDPWLFMMSKFHMLKCFTPEHSLGVYIDFCFPRTNLMLWTNCVTQWWWITCLSTKLANNFFLPLHWSSFWRRAHDYKNMFLHLMPRTFRIMNKCLSTGIFTDANQRDIINIFTPWNRDNICVFICQKLENLSNRPFQASVMSK